MDLDPRAVLSFGYHIGLGIAAIGSALGLGRAVGSAMDAIGRQPEAAARIQFAMIIGAAFIEALTIYALISVFLLRLVTGPLGVGLQAASGGG